MNALNTAKQMLVSNSKKINLSFKCSFFFFSGTLSVQTLPAKILSYVSLNVYLYFTLGTLVF